MSPAMWPERLPRHVQPQNNSRQREPPSRTAATGASASPGRRGGGWGRCRPRDGQGCPKLAPPQPGFAGSLKKSGNPHFSRTKWHPNIGLIPFLSPQVSFSIPAPRCCLRLPSAEPSVLPSWSLTATSSYAGGGGQPARFGRGRKVTEREEVLRSFVFEADAPQAAPNCAKGQSVGLLSAPRSKAGAPVIASREMPPRRVRGGQ